LAGRSGSGIIRFGGRFDVQRRAEEVPVAEFVALAAALPPGNDAAGSMVPAD